VVGVGNSWAVDLLNKTGRGKAGGRRSRRQEQEQEAGAGAGGRRQEAGGRRQEAGGRRQEPDINVEDEAFSIFQFPF